MIFNEAIDKMEEDIIKSLKEILSYPSVESEADGNMPFGKDVYECLEYTLNLAKDLGFKTKNIDNYAGYAEIGEGEEMVGILGHLDVVPAGDNWSYDPFKGTLVDGKLYGRGSTDDKGPMIAALYAVKAIVDSGMGINKRIRLIFGCNEETTWKGIKYYAEKEEHPTIGFTPDASFPVIHGEKGILVFELKKEFEDLLDDGGIEIISIKGGNAPNMVPDYCEAKIVETYPIDDIINAYMKDFNAKIELEREDGITTLKAYGVSAHGARPETGVNAISHMMNLLNVLDIQIGDLSNFIRFYANFIGLDHTGKGLNLNFKDDYGALTFNVGMIDFSKERGRLIINIRYPISETLKHVEETIKDNIFNYEYINHDHMKPIYFEKDHPLVKTLMDVYKEHTGDDIEPVTIGGGTYARAMDNIVAFGAAFPTDEELAHQKDEFIRISSLMKATKIYASAIYKLAQ